MFELAYSCGLRAEEIVSVDLGDVDFDSEAVRVTGKGRRRASFRSVNRLSARCDATSRRRVTRSGRSRGARAVRLAPRKTALALRRPAPPAEVGPGGRGGGPDLPAHPAPFLRDPPARGRRGSALDPGAARPFERLHDQIYTRVEPSRLRREYAKSHPRRRSTRGWRSATTFRTGSRMERNVKAVELRELWCLFKDEGDEQAASDSSSPTRRWSSSSPGGGRRACRLTWTSRT